LPAATAWPVLSVLGVLAVNTVCLYSIPQEIPMKHSFRQHYQPKPARTPEWLRRVWLWF